MTTEREGSTLIVLSWLREDAYENAERVLLRALDEVDTTPQRRRIGLARRSPKMHPSLKYALAAAAVLIVAVAATQLLPGVPGLGGQSPTPSPTPVATARLVRDGPLESGRWAFRIGGLEVSFDIPNDGWKKNVARDAIWTEDSEGRFTFQVPTDYFADPCDPTSVTEPADGPTVAQLSGAAAGVPDYEAPATAASLGGFEGNLVDITLPGSATPCGGEAVLWTHPDAGAIGPAAGERTRFWILDVNGTTLVVSAVERVGLATASRTELQQIIESITIKSS